jgi:hypothetical protein
LLGIEIATALFTAIACISTVRKNNMDIRFTAAQLQAVGKGVFMREECKIRFEILQKEIHKLMCAIGTWSGKPIHLLEADEKKTMKNEIEELLSWYEKFLNGDISGKELRGLTKNL